MNETRDRYTIEEQWRQSAISLANVTILLTAEIKRLHAITEWIPIQLQQPPDNTDVIILWYYNRTPKELFYRLAHKWEGINVLDEDGIDNIVVAYWQLLSPIPIAGT